MSQSTESTGNLRVEVRVARASDALILAQLRYAFRSSIDAPVEQEAVFIERCSRWMEQRLNESGSWRCWVAEKDQEIMGTLWLKLIEKIPNPVAELENHAYLTNFYVLEGARGTGIGTRLLSTALDWCRTASVHAVILWPTPESRTLYERHRFVVPSDLLELILLDPSAEGLPL